MSFDRLKKNISYILFTFGETANIIGLYNTIRRGNGRYSIIFTSLCLISMTILFIISLKKKKPDLFINLIVFITGVIYFPFIFFNTQKPQTFILNMLLIPPSYAIIVKRKRDYILPLVTFLLYLIILSFRLSIDFIIIFGVIYLYTLCVPSLFAIILNRYSEEITRENQKIAELATRDGLTGLYNRYELQKLVNGDEEWIPIMLDIDFFKKVNDTYGHDEGDKVLQRLAQIILRYAKDGFRAFRYGGEEFLIISKLSESSTLIRIKDFFGTVRRDLKTSDGKNVTISVGIGNKSILSDNSIKIADVNLYLCKNEGRNCICYKNEVLFK